MPVFTIDSEYAVTAQTDGVDIQPETFRATAATEKQLAAATKEWPAADLVALWNSFAGVVPFADLKPVKKFKDRKTAVSRIWHAIQKLAEDLPAQEPQTADTATAAAGVAPKAAKPRRSKKESTRASQTPVAREGSKKAAVVAMLQRKNGATLEEIMEKMGWQRHTVRGFMAGAMKKAGYTVESLRSDKGVRTYRIKQ